MGKIYYREEKFKVFEFKYNEIFEVFKCKICKFDSYFFVLIKIGVKKFKDVIIELDGLERLLFFDDKVKVVNEM